MTIESELTDISVVRYMIRRFGLRLKHRLGQNFLIRKDVVDAVVEASELTPESRVLEIGPGIGTLTQGLARTGAQVTALEIDERLKEILERTLEPYSNVKIIYGDVMKADLSGIMGGARWHVAANLPYYITTPVLILLIQSGLPIDLITVMMQKEVADRILAAPGGKEYGALTLAVRYYCEAEKIMDVPPSSFLPPPAVTSTVLRLRMRKNPPVTVRNEKLLFRLIKICFAQRRKIFSNNLRNGGISTDDAARILETAGIDGNRRAETFSLEEFGRLSDAWDQIQSEDRTNSSCKTETDIL